MLPIHAWSGGHPLVRGNLTSASLTSSERGDSSSSHNCINCSSVRGRSYTSSAHLSQRSGLCWLDFCGLVLVSTAMVTTREQPACLVRNTAFSKHSSPASSSYRLSSPSVMFPEPWQQQKGLIYMFMAEHSISDSQHTDLS